MLLLALMFALPNFFGEDPALQVARKDRTPIDECGRAGASRQFLKQRDVALRRAATSTTAA